MLHHPVLQPRRQCLGAGFWGAAPRPERDMSTDTWPTNGLRYLYAWAILLQTGRKRKVFALDTLYSLYFPVKCEDLEEIVCMELVVVFSELHRCADMVLSELIGDQSVLSDVNCKGMSCGGGGWSITAWPCCSCGSFWLILKLSVSTNTWQIFIQYLCSAVFTKLSIMVVTVVKKKLPSAFSVASSGFQTFSGSTSLH